MFFFICDFGNLVLVLMAVMLDVYDFGGCLSLGLMSGVDTSKGAHDGS